MMSLWPFLVLQVLVFVGLVVVLRRVLSRNLLDASAHLKDLGAEHATKHEELKRQLEETERQYGERMSQVQEESKQLISQARQEAESSRAKMIAEARSEGERIVQQALESSNGLQKEFEERLDRRAVARACELIQEVLPGQLRKDMQANWVDELIRDGLTKLDELTIEPGVTEAKITSAFPLEPSQRDLLRRRLKEKLGRDMTLVETRDEGLVVGFTVTLGSLVLDGSLLSKIRGAARHAQGNA